MFNRCHWLVVFILACPFLQILGLVVHLPNSIEQPSQPSVSAASSTSLNGTYTELSEDAPLAFKVQYRYTPNGARFDRISFLNTMISSVFSMTIWSWNSAIESAVVFPNELGICLRFIHIKGGPAMRTKHLVWTIEELFDILVEHERYAVGNFQVNDNWDEGRVAIGSLAVGPPDIALKTTTDTFSTEESEPPSSLIPVLQLPNVSISNTQVVAVNQSSSLGTENGIRVHLEHIPGGPTYQDTQIYNATLKVLIKISAATGSIWPMIATYNDMEDFTLSVRSISDAGRSELTLDQAAAVVAELPHRMDEWREVAGLITVNGKPRGVVCVDKGDRTNFITSMRCQQPANILYTSIE